MENKFPRRSLRIKEMLVKDPYKMPLSWAIGKGKRYPTLKKKNKNDNGDKSPVLPERSHLPLQENLVTSSSTSCQNDEVTAVHSISTTPNTNKDYRKMKETCTDVILQLIDTPTTPMLTRVVDFLLKNSRPKIIARTIVKISASDFECKIMNYSSPQIPQLSLTQLVLLYLLLEFNQKQCGDLISSFLKIAVETIRSANSITVLSPIARLHVAFLKMTIDYCRMRVMIGFALTNMKQLSIPYIHIIFTCWPEVFPKFQSLNEYNKLLARGLITAIHLFQSPYLLPLRNSLHHELGYPRNKENAEALLKELLSNYIETERDQTRAMILILGHNLPTKSFFNQINSTLRPITNSYVENESKSYSALNLLLFLMYQLRNKDDMRPVRLENRNWLKRFLNDDLPDAIKRECNIAINTTLLLTEEDEQEVS